MSEKELIEKLNQINIEDFIWIIYIIIIILSFYSNYLERDYYINKNDNSKNTYKKIIVIIFSVLVLVYLYYFIDSYNSFKSIKKNDTKKKKDLTTLSFIASLIVLISGIINLFIALNDQNLDVEIAFN